MDAKNEFAKFTNPISAKKMRRIEQETWKLWGYFHLNRDDLRSDYWCDWLCRFICEHVREPYQLLMLERQKVKQLQEQVRELKKEAGAVGDGPAA